ncbi:Bromodomain-containing protein [Gonapodya prolifera JEL478]|uniref:Bromodomain-containing protein n=1 Tax=Gonapodya prolifera (strain JEL478) TaxID=1344416 RepID=A0A139A4L6_GONPJ|nr:Bromodomain-containing protein [Gonapodya prolifera JEL478]|eukprot:KXS11548.1 Bromodomain-containing protein [Gonapodya prolifera JEL478]
MATNPASEPETVHSLLSDRNLRQCLSILRALQRFPDSRYFLRPVDPVADGAPDYYFVIQNPMDFQTIEQSLQARSYTLFGFNQDVMQVFTNCFTYNPPGTPVNAMGQRVKQYYVELAQSAFPEFIASLPGISFLDRRPKARHSTTSTSVTGSRNRSRSPSQSSRSPSVEGSDRESDNDAASERLSENADSQSRKRSRPSKPYPSSSSSAPSALPSDPNVSQPVSFPVISTKPVYAAPGSPTQQSNVPEGSPNEEEEDEDEEARKKIKHDGRVCEFCTATETPLWRAGPNGRNTLWMRRQMESWTSYLQERSLHCHRKRTHATTTTCPDCENQSTLWSKSGIRYPIR